MIGKESQPNPEREQLEAIRSKDRAYFQGIADQHPPADTETYSRHSIDAEGYFATGIAIACIDLGVPLGLVLDKDKEIGIYGSRDDINYWLTMSGLEYRDYAPDKQDGSAFTESRSGLWTLLRDPSSTDVFEHVYSAYTGIPIDDVMDLSPFYEGYLDSKVISLEKRIDQEGIDELFREDPAKVLRLLITRELHAMQGMRDHIKRTENFLLAAESGQIGDLEPDLIPHNKKDLSYKRTEYDFVSTLIMEGYQPYTLEDVVPMIEEYLLSYLAVHPESSPQNPDLTVEDRQAKIKKLLNDIKLRNEAENN